MQRAKHRSSPGKWNCVTGYIKERESAEEAAIRELKEETNLEGEIVLVAEPYWVDSGDTRWVVVAVLIKVQNVEKLKIDKNESQDHKWVTTEDELVGNSKALKTSLSKLGIN